MALRILTGRRALLLAACFLAMATTARASQESPTISPAASRYLTQALNLMQEHALHAKEIDWPALRIQTFWRAADAQSTVDTYPAICFALSQLKEHHSFLRLPDNLTDADRKRSLAVLRLMFTLRDGQLPQRSRSPFRSRTEPEGRLVHRGPLTFAYIAVPACGGTHADEKQNLVEYQQYADTLHGIAAGLQSAQPDGWIVDLRGNGGGNMYPMLAGIGFVLGEGDAGSFVSLDGTAQARWLYSQGDAIVVSGTTKSVDASVTAPPLSLAMLPPVAVLIDAGTISSGEAIAVSFAGRQRTRFFGARTYGLASGNVALPLSDRASLVLNESLDADRLGRTYPDGIPPDVSFPEPASLPDVNADSVVQVAAAWLATQTSALARHAFSP